MKQLAPLSKYNVTSILTCMFGAFLHNANLTKKSVTVILLDFTGFCFGEEHDFSSSKLLMIMCCYVVWQISCRRQTYREREREGREQRKERAKKGESKERREEREGIVFTDILACTSTSHLTFAQDNLHRYICALPSLWWPM